MPNRPDWRDPNMPVIRKAKLSDGTSKVVELSPEEEQAFAQRRLALADILVPDFRSDPTYNLRRKPAR